MPSRAASAAATFALLCAGVTSCASAEPPSSARPALTGSAVTTAAPVPPVLAAALEHGPVRPRSARETVAQLAAAEGAIADPAVGGRLLEVAGQVQQLAYRQLGGHPAWDASVRSALPRGLRALVAANVRIRREFRSMHPVLGSTLPAWRVRPPAPASRLRGFFREAERRTGVDWEYLAAINLVETAFGRIEGTSTAGAQGPMQFLPGTWATWGHGGDVHDPHDAILAAGRFLAHYGFARDPAAALYRYNHASAYVRGVVGLARIMQRRPRAYLGYHAWRVYYLTTRGDVLLPVGYAATKPIPVDTWLATHPQQDG